ncbi:hypothetical protein METBIDRAFT_15475, partial [Metschnikowia bicuspidata var. bicuspidata NRRL YB-4993]
VPTLLSFLASPDTSIKDLSIFLLYALTKKSSSTEKQITEYLMNSLKRDSPEMPAPSFTILSKSLETFFPIFPDSMTRIYVSEACKQAFLYQGLLLNPEKDVNDYSTAQQLLQVLSLSCIRETARKFNTENYLPLLIAGTALESSPTIRSLLLLCVVKLWNFSAIEKQISMDTVFTKTLSLFISADPASLECISLLEALAYLSLGAATKSALRANEQAIEQLVLLLETSLDPLVIYGCLLVILNLCRIKSADQDKDTNTLNYLKSMATEKSTADDSEESVIAFNLDLVSEHKLVSTMAALKNVKENSTAHIIQIIYSLTTKQSVATHRMIVSQGGLNINIKYLVEHSKVIKETSSTTAASSDETLLEVRLQSLRALATLCRSVNPTLAFSKYDVKTCVPFLVELLGPDLTVGLKAPFLPESFMGPGDKLCSLLALTNLSSKPDPDLHQSIVSRAFEQHLKNLMLDSTLFAVQKATWELINNLVAASPLMLAKFFNPESAESRRNLDLLVKMLHSQDESLQIVIAGLIANATMEFDLVSVSILVQKPIFENLCQIVASIFNQQAQNDDLILRVATFLQHLTSVAKASQKEALSVLRTDPALKSGIKTVVVTTKDANIMSLLRETIQLAEMK